MRKFYSSAIFTFLLMAILIIPVLASPKTPSLSPDIAQDILIDGNKRFVSERYTDSQTGQARRIELTKGQNPFAVIISCSDSRVPPELIFDQGLGDLFVVRVAGNVLDAIELGSVEYAVEHLGTKLIVVLGHEKCGAVKAAIDDSAELPPNVKAITTKIQPAVAAAITAQSTNIHEAAIDANITNMVAILKADPVIIHTKNVKILGAKYHLTSGEVEFTN
ncbi:Carbonic anhydrase [bioreactor metagenome]|uniref:carbonic anhydrase n=1 Tax=bioreactor metagenome TaxID=1076179 RepID=A0A644U810_9ZZZZ|nr:carbonic anhydrase [Negativicutes bacterium]